MSKEEQGTISHQDAYLENMRQMNTVIRQMKEIPELPSEEPKDVCALTKVEFPEEGGILTYMENHKYPYRGFPYGEFVEKIDVMKKVLRATLSGAFHELKNRPKIVLVTLLPAIWVIRPIVRINVYVFFRMIERFKIKTHRYSQPMRELHRVFSFRTKSEKNPEFRTQLRDLICMTAEFDNAYRYRMQDLLVEVDKAKLKTNPIKEIIRLLSLMQSREKTQDVRDTWDLIKLAITYYLKFDKELLKIAVGVLSNLDLNEFELKDEDKEYCRPRKDYNFKFIEKE